MADTEKGRNSGRMRKRTLPEFNDMGNLSGKESALGGPVAVGKVGGIEARGRALAAFCRQHKKNCLPGEVVAGNALGKLVQSCPVQLFFWPADHVCAKHRGFWRQAARKLIL